MTTETLKPCPFCGSTDLEHQHLEGTILNPAWSIYCGYCGARSRYDDAGDYIPAWNTRADADRIEALTAEVAAYGRSLELKQALIEDLKADNDMLRKVIARYQNVCGVLTQSDRDYLTAALEKQP
jgi:Lar family restriction alleviation protein